MLIKNYGENYRDDPRYQALPDHMKDPEDKEKWIVDEEDVLVGPEEDNDNLGL